MDAASILLPPEEEEDALLVVWMQEVGYGPVHAIRVRGTRPGVKMLQEKLHEKDQAYIPGLGAVGGQWGPTLLIFGHPVRRGVGRSEDLLMGLLMGLAKLLINRSRQQATKGVIMAECLPLVRGYVCAQVSLEKEHAVSTNILSTFQK
eukprot:g26509.t1